MGVILYEFLYGVPPFVGQTVEALFYQTLNVDVVFPDSPASDNDAAHKVSDEAKDLILHLLEKDFLYRLGTPPAPMNAPYEVVMHGAYYVKEHPFFSMAIEDEDGISWDALLQEKACFVPELDNDLDTSYFDRRTYVVESGFFLKISH
jgi:microtubule-associated serine/threonine kinase